MFETVRRSKFLHRFGSYAFAALMVLTISGRAALAQDPVKLAPESYKVALENDSVRVCNVEAKAGAKVAMHSHPDHLAYAVKGGKVKFTYPDGKSKEVELKTGEATWIKAETHATENVGTTDLKLVVFELKKPAVPGSKAKMPAGDDQVKACPESTKVLLNNERVRLLDVRLKSTGKLAKHSHPVHVAYALEDAKYKVTTADGKTEEKSIKAGEAKWNDATSHSVENPSSTELHSLLLEWNE